MLVFRTDFPARHVQDSVDGLGHIIGLNDLLFPFFGIAWYHNRSPVVVGIGGVTYSSRAACRFACMSLTALGSWVA